MRAYDRAKARAKDLRRTMSPPEVRLWKQLRHRQPGEPVFRRQHPLGPYVIDFYCPMAKLAVEIDGSSHGLGDQPLRDARKDEFLRSLGITIERISARAVLEEPNWIANGLRRLAQDMTARSPASYDPPPFTGEVDAKRTEGV